MTHRRSFILAAALTACLFPLWGIGGLHAQVTVIDSGYCGASGGTNLSWKLTSDSVFTISGSGAMANYTYSSRSPWYAYYPQIKTIHIDNSVTTIGDFAFYNCSTLTSITIPDNATTIGSGAFYGCDSLSSVNIPNTIKTIENYAFYGCKKLTSITIPNNITAIESGVFGNCISLTSIIIPNNVTHIGGYAFYGCDSLSSVNIPNNVATIGNYAFSGCKKLTSIIIPNNVTTIGSYAFSGCNNLTDVTIGRDMRRIESGAFYDCSSLTSLTIYTTSPPGLFDKNTFYNVSNTFAIYVLCGLIPTYQSGWGWSDFNYVEMPISPLIQGTCGAQGNNLTWQLPLCDGILTISGSGDMANYSWNPPWYFSYRNRIKTIEIGDSVKSIGNYAFYNCSDLISVTIGNTVVSIGENAFRDCVNLTSINIPDSVIVIGDMAFYGCSSLTTSVIIPDGVTTIGNGVFWGCSSLTSIIIPNGNITSIGNGAFYNCNGLTSSITIPDGVTFIGNSAFSGCSNLPSINVDNNNSRYSSIDGILYNKAQDTLIKCPEGKTGIVVIPNSVTTIENFAFQNCSKLTSVTIPNNVTNIGDYVFSGCCSLAAVSIPNGITSIGNSAFEKCKSLTSITIPNNVAQIGDWVFWACNSLQTVNYNAINCKIRLVSNGGSIVSAFYGCSAFTTLNIGDSVQTIPDYAFCDCRSLTSITCSATYPPILGYRCFYDVSKTIPIHIPCLTYDKYTKEAGWSDFTNYVIDGSVTTFYTAKCYFPYSDNNFTMLSNAGIYYKTLPNSSMVCDSVVCLTLVENPLPQLCMVSVDENNHNEIVWKQWDKDVSYNIYREGSQNGQYFLAATIEPNNPNIWVDTASDAKKSSYRYKVSGVDIYGTESALSNAHRTMYLFINAGQNNSWKLIWTAYTGMTYSAYNIYRASGDTPDAFTLIGTAPMGGANIVYIDSSAPAGYVYYMVEIVLDEPCVLSKSLSSIKSNIASNNPVGIVSPTLNNLLWVYPNPAGNQLTISLP